MFIFTKAIRHLLSGDMTIKNYEKYLSIFLWLVAIHSISVGIGLLIIPPSFLGYFGLIDYKESFFQAQGGVFHLAVSIAYCMAAAAPRRSIQLITFIISLKLFAFVFLAIYFLFVLHSWLILLSAAADGLMGVIILMLFKLSKINEGSNEQSVSNDDN